MKIIPPGTGTDFKKVLIQPENRSCLRRTCFRGLAPKGLSLLAGITSRYRLRRRNPLGIQPLGNSIRSNIGFRVQTFVLALILAGAGRTFANVTVTAASSVTNSADLAQNGATPAWTTLSGIVITEPGNSRVDFGSGTNITLILTAPDGWQFNAGVGTVTYKTSNADIKSAVLSSVDDSTITVTLTVDGTGDHVDSLTISGIQVQATEGGDLPAAGNILRTSANPGTATITGIVNDTTSFGSLSQIHGDPRVYTVLPGQTFTDADSVAASGISGSPDAQTVGIPFDIASLVVADREYNIDASYSGAMTVSYSGPGNGSTLSPAYTTNVSFTSGTSTTTLATTLGKAETVAITATDGTVAGVASSNLTVNKGSQTISFGALAGKTYGDAPFEVDATASSGLPVSFNIASGPATVFEETVTITGAGDVTVRASQADDNDWNDATPVDQSFNVARLNITGGFTAANKTYDGTTNATVLTRTLTGVLPGDVGNVTLTGGTASFADANAAPGKTVTLTGATLGGPAADNYSLTSVDTTTADITKAPATVVLGSLAQTYNGTVRNATATTTPDGLTVLFTYNGSASAPTNAGIYEVIGTVDEVNYAGSATNNLNVARVDVAGSFTADNKTYDGTTNATVLTRALTGVLPGDTANVSLTGGTASFADANAGTGKTVTLTGASLDGAAADNYSLTSVGTTTADITKAAATVMLGSLSQAYDGTGRHATATTTPDGLTVLFTYNGSANAPTNVGIYVVIGTVDEVNYTGSATNNLTVTCPVIVFSPMTISNAIRNVKYTNYLSGAGGVGPYTYAKVGTLPPGLTLTASGAKAGMLSGTPTAYGKYTFTITTTDAFACPGSQDYTMLVGSPADAIAPTVTIKTPTPFGYTEASSVVVTGTVSDAVFVTNVEVSVDGGAWQTANLVSNAASTSWSLNIGALTPSVGTNLHRVAARATDWIGNTGTGAAIKTNAFYYGVRSPLTIVSNGVYKFTPSANGIYGKPNNGALLVVGKTYKFTVSKSDTNFVFSNIVFNADAPLGTPGAAASTFTFVMTSNLTLTVNYVSNRFSPLAGSYNGLFDSGDLITLSNRGFFSGKVVASAGALAYLSGGNLYVSGLKLKVPKVTFNLQGQGSAVVTRGSDTPITVALAFPFDGGNMITGTVSTVDWAGVLIADRAVRTNLYAGYYTIAIPGNPTLAATEPGGYGYGFISIDTNGVLKLAGSKLADNQNLAQKVPVSVNGDWPLFSWANKDANKVYQSAIMGWVSVINGVVTNNGPLVWINNGTPGTRYPAGFTNVINDLLGSAYASNAPVIALLGGTGLLTLDSPQLTSMISQSVILTVSNKFIMATPDNPEQIKLTLTPKTGRVTGNFRTEQFGHANMTSVYAVVVTNVNAVKGYLLMNIGSGVNESGAFEINP